MINTDYASSQINGPGINIKLNFWAINVLFLQY